jgi:hypothetical protein
MQQWHAALPLVHTQLLTEVVGINNKAS